MPAKIILLATKSYKTYRKGSSIIHTCVIKGSKYLVAFLDRFFIKHSRFVTDANAAGKCDILFIGDSIIQQLQLTKLYSRELPKDKIILNFGIGGDRVEHVQWRIEDGNWLEKILPNLVVLFVGTNNVNCAAAEVFKGITHLVQTIKKKSPNSRIILPLLLPKGQRPNKLRVQNNEVNKLLINKYASKDDNVYVVDTNAKTFLDDDGSISHLLMHDYLHLTEKGYEISFRPVFNKIKELLINK